MATAFDVTVVPVRDLGLGDAQDPPIFDAAKAAGVTVMTKDADFAEMVERLGPPPQILWLRCGNTSNAALSEVLLREFPNARRQLTSGASLVEIGTDIDF